jgi:ATP10 protein
MKTFFFIAALSAGLIVAEPVGEIFPDLKGETLTDKTISIPNDTKGKSTIICMAYSEDAEKDLKTWYEPTYDKFIAKTELMADAYDLNVYFVPMFTGIKAGAAASAKKQMKQDVQPDLQPHVIVYKGEIDAYRDKLKMDDKKKPYIFVLDKTGKIVFVTSGAYTEDKMDAIDDNIE